MKSNDSKGAASKWYLLIAGAVVVVAAVVIGVVLWTQAGSKKDIKVGVIAPLTGTAALWGQGSLDMMQIAVDEINAAGGIDGANIVLVPEDGQCQSEPAVTAANKLISVDGVKFILGGHCSPETVGIAPILDANQVFGLAGVSTATGILDSTSYVFRTSPTNLVQARLIAKLAKEKYGIKTVSVITEQTAFAKSISTDFVTAFKEQGGQVLSEEAVQTDQGDFRTELLRIQSKNPDAIFVSPQSPGVGTELMKQIKELGITAKLTGNTVFLSIKVQADSGNLIPADAFTVAPFADPASPATAALIAKYKARFGKDVPYNTFFVGAAYDGVYMLKSALDSCGPEPTCVRDFFNGITNFQGAVAEYTFDDKGDPQIANWKEQRIQGSQAVFEAIQ